MDWQVRPHRALGLEINRVMDGYIVFQADRARLHYLNHTAALILEACDGRITAAEMPGLIAALCHLPEPPIQDVEHCLDKLLTEGLLVDGVPVGTNGAFGA